MTSPLYLPYRLDQWRGWVRQDWATILQQHDPITWLESQPRELVRDHLSRKVYRVDHPQATIFFKDIRGLNERSMQKPGRWVDVLKWQLRPSRALATLKVSRQLLDAGLLCPAPILAARCYAGRQTRDVFLNDAITLPTLGSMLKQAADHDQRIAIMKQVAIHIAQLHDRRFIHGDLLPNNLHASDDLKQLYYLDNDRTRLWPVPPPSWLIRHNLAQMAYRLMAFEHEPVALVFLHAYGQARGWSEGRTQRYARMVMKAVHKRMIRQPVNPASRIIPQSPRVS